MDFLMILASLLEATPNIYHFFIKKTKTIVMGFDLFIF